MKSRCILLLICIISCTLQAQNSHVDLCEVFQLSKSKRNLDSLNHLLSLDTTQINADERAELLSMRGRLKLEFYNKKKSKSSAEFLRIKEQAHADFTEAVELSRSVDRITTFAFRRYTSLDHYNYQYPELNVDRKYLADRGMKHERFDIGLSLLTKYDNDYWLGGEFSLFSGYGPTYALRENSGEIIHKRKLSVAASFFVFGYAHNFDNPMDEFRLSVFRVEAPLYIDLTQFGVIEEKFTSHWFYRPEIGIGYQFLHFSVGYSAFFKGERAQHLPKFSYQLRLKHTF